MRRLLFVLLTLLCLVPLFWGTTCPSTYTQYFMVVIPAQSSNSTNLINFPVLYPGDPRLATTTYGGYATSSSGYDIAFCSGPPGSGNLYNWEMVNYNPVTGMGQFYVQVPSVGYVASTGIYVVVGASSITTYQGNNAATWANYLLVAHLYNANSLVNSVTGAALTNTGGATTVAPSTTPASQYSVAGAFGAINFASGQYLVSDVTSATIGTTFPFTSSALGYWSNSGGSSYGSGGDYGNSGNTGGWADQMYNSRHYCWVGNGSSQSSIYSSTTYSAGTHYMVCTATSGNASTGMTQYTDGTSGQTVNNNNVTTMSNSGVNYRIGMDDNTTQYWLGQLSEVRFGKFSETADWDRSEDSNLSNPFSFFSMNFLTVQVSGSATVTSSDSHITCPSTNCSYNYTSGGNSLTLMASGGGIWTGCDSFTASTCTITSFSYARQITFTAYSFYVQGAQGLATSTNTLSVAYPSNNTAGDLLVAFADGQGASFTAAPTDTAGNTWTKLYQFQDGSHFGNWYYVCNAKAGANTVTQTNSGSSTYGLHIYEFKGNLTSSCYDVGNYSGTFGSPSQSTPSATTNQPDLVLFDFYYYSNTSSTFTVNSPYVIAQQTLVSGSGLQQSGFSTTFTTNDVIQTVTGTNGNGDHLTQSIFTFKMAAAGTPRQKRVTAAAQ
jgi:hypothetical protein